MELKERALLVGVNLNDNADFHKSMKELENLAEACGYEVAGRTEQNLKPSQCLLHHGKVKAAALVEAGKLMWRSLM